jgi:hypothetical protein
VANAEMLALCVIAERLKNEEDVPDIAGLFLERHEPMEINQSEVRLDGFA